MPDFTRVKDKITGHEFSVRWPNPDQHDVLDKDAVDANGDPLPPKPKTSAATKAAEKKNGGGEPAGTPEEGSK